MKFTRRIRNLTKEFIITGGSQVLVFTLTIILSPLLLLWAIALAFDNAFFNGRYLIKDTKTTPGELADSLEELLKHEGQASEEAIDYFESWYGDDFECVAFYDEELEEKRSRILKAELASESKIVDGAYRLDPATKAIVEEVIEELRNS